MKTEDRLDNLLPDPRDTAKSIHKQVVELQRKEKISYARAKADFPQPNIEGGATQPGTEAQQIISRRHHASCKPSDRDLVWLCAQCGERESAEPLLNNAEALAEACKAMMHDLDIFYAKYREPGNKYIANLKSALAKWDSVSYETTSRREETKQ
jgi:hypothetical protein